VSNQKPSPLEGVFAYSYRGSFGQASAVKDQGFAGYLNFLPGNQLEGMGWTSIPDNPNSPMPVKFHGSYDVGTGDPVTGFFETIDEKDLHIQYFYVAVKRHNLVSELKFVMTKASKLVSGQEQQRFPAVAGTMTRVNTDSSGGDT